MMCRDGAAPCLKASCYVLTALPQLSLTSHSELSLYMLMQASPSNGCTVARASSDNSTAAVRDFYSTSAKAFSSRGCTPRFTARVV